MCNSKLISSILDVSKHRALYSPKKFPARWIMWRCHGVVSCHALNRVQLYKHLWILLMWTWTHVLIRCDRLRTVLVWVRWSLQQGFWMCCASTKCGTKFTLLHFYHLKKIYPIHYKHICSHIPHIYEHIYAHSLPLYISVSKKLDWLILRWRRTSYTAQYPLTDMSLELEGQS